MIHVARLTAAAGLMLAASIAGAQDEIPVQIVTELPAGEQSPAFEAWTPTWTNDAAMMVNQSLAGAWLSKATVPGYEEGSEARIVLLINPVPVEGLTDTFYMESYRTDDPANPYRQSFLQVYDAGGKPRMRSFELNFPAPGPREIGKPVDTHGLLDGMGLAAEAFPQIGVEDLIATQDFDLTISAGTVSGKTPYPYPTAQGGAYTMTSQFSVSGDTLTTADRGFGADGSIVWGAGSDADFAFERAQPHISVTRQSNGVILLDMKTGEGPAIQDGGMLHVQYAGWLADGHMFDTSRQPNRDVFNFPFPPRLIDAWNTGLNGLSTGAVRRVICPSETGYGAQGQPRAEIPGNSTLYFTVEVMLAQQPPEADTDEGEDRGDDEG